MSRIIGLQNVDLGIGTRPIVIFVGGNHLFLTMFCLFKTN